MVRSLVVGMLAGCAGGSDMEVVLDAASREVGPGATAFVQVFGSLSGTMDGSPTEIAHDLVDLRELPDTLRVELPPDPHQLVPDANRPEDVSYDVSVEVDVDGSGEVCGPNDLYGVASAPGPLGSVSVVLAAPSRDCR